MFRLFRVLVAQSVLNAVLPFYQLLDQLWHVGKIWAGEHRRYFHYQLSKQTKIRLRAADRDCFRATVSLLRQIKSLNINLGIKYVGDQKVKVGLPSIYVIDTVWFVMSLRFSKMGHIYCQVLITFRCQDLKVRRCRRFPWAGAARQWAWPLVSTGSRWRRMNLMGREALLDRPASYTLNVRQS